MPSIQLLIGRVLKIGALLSFLMVMIGGSGYLYHHGNDIAQFQTFHAETNTFKSAITIIKNVRTGSALALIEFGLLVLVLIQLIRVLLTMWLFIQRREKIFILISFFISGVMIYSLFFV